MDQPTQTQPLLLATVLIDQRGHRIARQQGKTLTSSLIRHFFEGDILIWRNFSEPIYPVKRVGVHETEFVPEELVVPKKDTTDIIQSARLKQARSLIEHAARYRWVILGEMNVLCLRNLDHLFENAKGDVLGNEREDGTMDTGFLAVKGEIFAQFVHAWQSCSKESTLRSELEAAGLSVSHFERGEFVRPFDEGCTVRDVLSAAVVHLEGGEIADQTKLGFALHIMKIFGDEDGVFLDLMDS
jgi:hypothetical protein